MKTTVDIADPLFDRAKREAEASGTTMRELIELGLTRVLEMRAERRVKPFKLRDCSVGGEGVVPGVREDDARAMRYYSYMGTIGMPDTIEGINALVDEERAAAAAEKAEKAAQAASEPVARREGGRR